MHDLYPITTNSNNYSTIFMEWTNLTFKNLLFLLYKIHPRCTKGYEVAIFILKLFSSVWSKLVFQNILDF